MDAQIVEISPTELAAELESEHPPKILDVREDHELEISRLPEVLNVPLGELPERVAWLDKETNYVVVCRVGGRSGHACAYLQGLGYKVRNLTGGMNGWVKTVDPSQPAY